MGLSSRKPNLSIEECCQQFYDSNIFHSKIVAGRDFWSIALDTILKSVAEFDQSFLSVDPTIFRNEMTALRMELFAFALASSKKFNTEKYTIPQSLFTRSYLEENRNLEIWDIMAEYNQAIAMSATMNAKGEQFSGRIGIAQITFVNDSRSRMALRWAKNILGNGTVPTEERKAKIECINSVANRIGADTKREDDVVVKLLCSRLANRLRCDVNLKSEALFRLATTIFGFYKGAEEYLKSVDLQAKELS